MGTAVAHRTGQRRTTGLVLAFLALLVAGAWVAIATYGDNGVKVGRDDFGTAWPLTVPDGTLYCLSGRQITFVGDGTEYLVHPAEERTAYVDIGKIQAVDADGDRMDLRPLIERARPLCN